MAKHNKHNETMYVQCELEKPMDNGIARMVSWIRQSIAIPGAILDKLEDPETGRIETGWKVVNATLPALRESLIIRMSHDYDKMKLRTDI